jgi:hypothetical protein
MHIITDGGGKSTEVPDVAGKAMVRPEGGEEAPALDEEAVTILALDACAHLGHQGMFRWLMTTI